IASLPTTACPPFPWPPMLAVGLAVDHAFAGDRNILLLKGVNERRVAHQFHSLPTCEDVGQILSRVLTKFDRGVFSQVEIDVALEMNCTRKELTRRHQHATAAGSIACRDRFGKGFGAINLAVPGRAEFSHIEISVRENRRLDARENL